MFHIHGTQQPYGWTRKWYVQHDVALGNTHWPSSQPGQQTWNSQRNPRNASRLRQFRECVGLAAPCRRHSAVARWSGLHAVGTMQAFAASSWNCRRRRCAPSCSRPQAKKSRDVDGSSATDTSLPLLTSDSTNPLAMKSDSFEPRPERKANRGSHFVT